jgi:hypothetical protein
LPHLPPDLGQDLEGKSHPIREASSIFVGSLVEERRPELIDQVVVRHRDLDAVQIARSAAASRFAERPDQHHDLLGLELVGHLAVDVFRDLGGCQKRV